jgi:hypothetical protein
MSLHLRVFLASPGDVADERALALRLLKDDLPVDPFLRGRVTFDVVSWDDPAAPTPLPARLTPQEAVIQFETKPSECDIVIVVLWSRLGAHLDLTKFQKTNGDPYLSGTEWEYEDGCKHYSLKTSIGLNISRLLDLQSEMVINWALTVRARSGERLEHLNQALADLGQRWKGRRSGFGRPEVHFFPEAASAGGSKRRSSSAARDGVEHASFDTRNGRAPIPPSFAGVLVRRPSAP